ncbi:MAG: hypothetical protein K2P81_07565 [Bacteriovoracaceae bacterium]|nr:hypothetical protein [Bacteriovoracaceae bacterium]
MKYLLILAFTPVLCFANEIQGTMMLKGTAKTKIIINGIEAKCSVKVDEVKNTMTEDSFGNPAYRVWTKIEVSGSNSDRTVKIDQSNSVRFTNLHKTAEGTQVDDFKYVSEDNSRSTLMINEKGRITSAEFPVGAKLVRCNF